MVRRSARLAVAALAALLAGRAGRVSAAVPTVPLVDFRGAVVPEGRYRGKVTVFFVCGRRSSREIERLTRPFGTLHGEDPRVAYLTIVDLRSVPRLFAPIVHAALGRAQRQTAARIQRWRAEAGRGPDPTLPGSLALVTDWDGRIQAELGTRHDDREVEMSVVSPDGRPLGVYSGERGLPRLFEAVEGALGDEAGR